MNDTQRLAKWLGRTVKSGECWLWPGALDLGGYGKATIDGDSNIKIHRWVFGQVNGYLPQTVRHSCDNPRCIRPEHLLPGTMTDNMQDRSERGRTHNHVAGNEISAIVARRESGMSYKDIAAELNIKMKRVEYILTRRRLAICAES